MPTQGLPCSLAVVLESPDTQELTWRLAVCVCVCVSVHFLKLLWLSVWGITFCCCHKSAHRCDSHPINELVHEMEIRGTQQRREQDVLATKALIISDRSASRSSYLTPFASHKLLNATACVGFTISSLSAHCNLNWKQWQGAFIDTWSRQVWIIGQCNEFRNC